MGRKGFAGGAVPTATVAAMTVAVPGIGDPFDIASSTGWTFSSPVFVVVVNRGKVDEEKILCSSITGATLTVGERGYDGTSAADHDAGATILHVLDSITVDESNAHANAAHSYTHVQLTPAATWTVTHNLGFFPAVTIVNSSGDVVFGDINHVDPDSLTASFSGPFSGKVYTS